MGRYAVDDSAPSQGLVLIDGSEDASVQLAPCCRPIPGDAIVGYLGRGEGLVVHTADCGVGKRLLERDSERWMRRRLGREPMRAFETGVVAAGAATARACWRTSPRRWPTPRPTSPTSTWATSRRSETTELRFVLSVRDRLAPGRGDAHAEALAVGAARSRASSPDAAASAGAAAQAPGSSPRAPRSSRTPRRRHQLHLVADARLQQRPRDRRDPAHLAAARCRPRRCP